jgi:2,3-bisphosphoglycerate-independent phosphoglycerate mutase
MSAPEVAQTVFEQAASRQHDVIIVNFANGDMVGHTGKIEAAVQAVKTIDQLLAEIIPPILATGATFLVTADHGNCEEMIAGDSTVLTAHSLNLVPFVAAAQSLKGHPETLGEGPYGLADIAPTILKLLDLPIPPEMTGKSLL